MLKKILKSKISLAAASAIALTASPLLHSAAFGGSIVTDISTGVDGYWQVSSIGNPSSYSFSAPLTNGLVTAVPESTATGWIGAVGHSSWVAPSASDSGSKPSDGPGFYVYQLSLGSLIAGDAYSITGEAGAPFAEATADNDFVGGVGYLTSSGTTTHFLLTEIGNTNINAGSSDVQGFKVDFSAPTGLGGIAGTSNYLDFVVYNANSGAPQDTGFDLSAVLTDTSTAAAAPGSTPLPKPALAGFGLFAVLGLVGRRRVRPIA